METMRPAAAREYWKALIDNASSLIADAHVLLGVESFGRARSLKVLAQEELGKALWIYEIFQGAWSEGDEMPRAVDVLKRDGRNHAKKYLEAFVFGDELASFWSDYDALHAGRNAGAPWEEAWVRMEQEAEEASKEANLQKQCGFYVDRDVSGTVQTPAAIEAGSISDDLQVAAQVVEMLLIKDHSRMKFEAKTPYDGTHTQQFRLLPISHPEGWATASEDFKRSQDRPPV